MADTFATLYNRIRSNTGIILVNTFEETRLIRNIKAEFPTDSIQFWSATQGLHEIPKETDPQRVKTHHYSPDAARTVLNERKTSTVGNILNALEAAEVDARLKINQKRVGVRNIYIFRDADKFFNNPMTIRKIRDISYLIAVSTGNIIITGPGMSVPVDLEKEAAYLELARPDLKEIKDKLIVGRIGELIKANNKSVTDNNGLPSDLLDDKYDVDRISKACCGLTEDEIVSTASYSITTKKTLDEQMILEEKRQIINKNDILSYYVCDENMDDVGGFGELKHWFDVQQLAMDSEHAAAFGVTPPKAAVIVGVQGAGKSHICKALAKKWNKGLIKLDMGRVYAGLVGESEKRMRMALDQAEAAGGIIMIDEMDKGLAGAGSSDKTDGGTTKRVIGTLLDWMQTPHPGVFVIATANDITGLMNSHPELLRKGRIDEIWFADCPTADERKEIFSIHLRKTGRDVSKFDLNKLAAYEFEDSLGKKYSVVGAEIEHAIKEAIVFKFHKSFTGKAIKIGGKDDINTNDIMTQLVKIKPITYIGKNHVDKMREWAANNATRVSSIVETKVDTKPSKRKEINVQDDDLV